MKLKRGKMLVDPPASASSDIAFILIIFFLVCAAVQPETGLAQVLPKTEEKKEKNEQSKNIEVSITPTSIVLNGSPLQLPEFAQRLTAELQKKTREADRIVVVKSTPNTPYPIWIRVSQVIEQAGGILTLELESKKNNHGRMKLPRKKLTASIPAFAMGDIGFLLLIFFVILARAQDDSHIQWQPARLPDIEMAAAPLASVAIDSGFKTYLDGKEISPDELAGALASILGDTPTGERNVFLKVHKEAKASHFEPVIAAISEAGGDLVHILEPENTPTQP